MQVEFEKVDAYEPDRTLKGKLRRRLIRLAHRRPAKVALERPMVSFSFDDAPATACEAGARVQACSVYRRACPRLDAAGQALLDAALVRPREHVWLFSSSEAIGHLQQLAAVAPQASPRPAPDWSAGLALATHERIAARAQALGFGHVVLVRPDATAVARGWRRLSGSTLESDAL